MTQAARERWQVRTPLWTVSATAWTWCVLEILNGSYQDSHDNETASIMLWDWALMIAAMMGPLLRHPISHVYARTFSHRRFHAVSLFICGYTCVWILIGFGLNLTLPTNVYLLIVCLVMWQFSPMKQLCLNWRRAHPEIGAFGWVAYRDTLVFGIRHGLWCLGSCLLLMALAMLFAGWLKIGMMVAISLLMMAEQIESPSPPKWAIRAPTRWVYMLLMWGRIFLQKLQGSHLHHQAS